MTLGHYITCVCGLFLKWEVWFSDSPGRTSEHDDMYLHSQYCDIRAELHSPTGLISPSFPGRTPSLCSSPRSRCSSIPHLQPGVGIAERANPQSGINMGILEPTVYENIVNFSVLHQSHVEAHLLLFWKTKPGGLTFSTRKLLEPQCLLLALSFFLSFSLSLYLSICLSIFRRVIISDCLL